MKDRRAGLLLPLRRFCSLARTLEEMTWKADGEALREYKFIESRNRSYSS